MSLALSIALALFMATAVFMSVGWFATIAGEKLSAVIEEERQRERPMILDVLGKPFVNHMPEFLRERAEKMILYAGRPYDLKPPDMMGLMAVAAIGGAWGGILTARLMDWPPYTGVVTAALALLVPWIWLRDQVLRRHLHIMRDLPFHIDLLTLAVEAGLDFAAAVAKMVEKGRPGPVREEFKVLLSEVRVGKTRAEAMTDMAERVGLPSLSSFLGVLIQADRLGTGIGKVLRIQADQMRIERSQLAEKKAAEAPVKMLLPLVVFIFPTIWVILAAPLIFQWMFNQ